MNDPRGSIWRKWDLHLHTPASGKDYDDQSVTDELLISNIKAAGIAAVAITDHHRIDVDKILKLQKLAGEELQIFPGIECRSELGGSETVHFTGIFPNNLSEEELADIWTKISGARKLTEKDRKEIGEDKLYCDLKETALLIHQLGGLVAAHAGTKTNTIENIKSDVEKFKNQIKTDLVEGYIDILEIGKPEDQLDYERIVFPSIGFELPMICCSDNHDIKKYENNRFSWIKADPTFEGLRQILYEPRDRVFIGDEPEILKRVKNNKTKYIRSLEFKKVDDSNLTDEIWFAENEKINVNPGFVSIIGNKGSGKSALADTFGLLGDTRQSNNFSFLNEKKFKNKKDNKAKHFNANIEWESGDTSGKNLNDEVNENTVETVKCIPQNYLETICTEQLEGSLFNDELKQVIFSHISTTEKLSFNTLDDLIKFKTKEKNHAIEIVKSEIAKLNKDIALLEIKLHPDYRELINNKLQIKKQEKAAHQRVKPPKKEKPQTSKEQQKMTEEITNAINEKVENILKLDEEIVQLNAEKENYYKIFINSKKLLDKLDNFQKQYDLFKAECEEIAKILSININDIISFEIKKNDLQALKTKSSAGYTEKSNMLEEKRQDGPAYKKQQLLKEIDTLREKLDQQNKEYQKYLKEKAEWEEKLKTIEGNDTTPDTIKFYEKQLADIDAIPSGLDEKKKLRLAKALEIHKQLSELRDEYSNLYKPVKDFIDNHEFTTSDKFSMDFRASITCVDFSKQFFNFVAQNKRGSFYGADDGRKKLKEVLDGSEFDSRAGLIQYLEKIEEHLCKDKREEFLDVNRYVVDQLLQDVKIENFYNFIYSLDYLKPEYILQWAGKDLNQLSPGERGTVLLIFYLFISQESTPLVIDQPEGNLDNQTVYGILRPCIKLAKNRRQIIVVTHNPNLAVVCDADQVIHCEMKKEENNKITYTSGAIENPAINKALIDILEGTRPAFSKRDDKYYVD